MPRDELAQVLWGDVLPATWDKALTVLVSKLRALLVEVGVDGAQALTSAFGCYRLELPPDTWVDVLCATSAARDAERALAAGDEAGTAATLAESLTRRPFLPGDNGTWVEAKRRELADVRWRAVQCLAAACLAAGETSDAAAWAEQAITLEPFRETGYMVLMEAHAAAGNRAEALRVYDRCRRLLDDELGTYPSPETESIYRRLLESPVAAEPAAPVTAAAAAPVAAEPAALVTRPAARRTRSRRRVALAAGAVVLAAVGAIIAVAASRDRHHGAAVAAAENSVVALDESGAIVADVGVGSRPVAITAAAGSLWIANLDDRSVSRVDLSTRRVVRSIPTGAAPAGLTATASAIWVSGADGAIARIDPQYDSATHVQQLTAHPLTSGHCSPRTDRFGQSCRTATPSASTGRRGERAVRSTSATTRRPSPPALVRCG